MDIKTFERAVVSATVFIICLGFAGLYFKIFTQDLSDVFPFDYALNLGDHLVYARIIEGGTLTLQDRFVFSSDINDIGISLIYQNLMLLFGANSLFTVAFWFNVSCFLVCSVIASRIAWYVGISKYWSLLIFASPQFIYFSQTVSKEPLALLMILLMVWYVVSKQRFGFFIVALLSGFVRIQLPVVAVLFLYLSYRGYSRQRLMIVYLITAVGGVWVSRFAPGLADTFETGLGFGISELVRQWNIDFGLGTLLLNPIRVVQYYYDLSRSLLFFRKGRINLYYLRDVPFFCLVTFFLPSYWYYLRHRSRLHHSTDIMFNIIYAYLLVQLTYPIIHARYLFAIYPMLIFLGVSLRKQRTRSSVPEATRRVGATRYV